jgi:hypothetical protein
VDGWKARNLRELVRAVEAPSGERFVSFDLSNGYRVTVDRSQATASASEVLARYGVASDRSARLRALLEAPVVAGGSAALGGSSPAGGR